VIGRLLRPIRSSAARSPLAAPAFTAPDTIVITSAAFTSGGPMPMRCAGPGVGANRSPQLRWTGTPATAEHLLLVLDDVGVPLPAPLIHSMAVLEALLDGLDENAFRTGPGVRIVPTRLGKTGYAGPRPIPGHGPHGYRFHLLALNRRIPEEADSVRSVLAAAAGHVLARGMLTGTFQR
jgi:phosphatidylethanolamine-binding protein (PEBP) family uncharacterized protein